MMGLNFIHVSERDPVDVVRIHCGYFTTNWADHPGILGTNILGSRLLIWINFNINTGN